MQMVSNHKVSDSRYSSCRKYGKSNELLCIHVKYARLYPPICNIKDYTLSKVTRVILTIEYVTNKCNGV